nr:unnamed protein product [Digitaria exilis]
MEDAMGQAILRRDTVMFKPSPGAAHWVSSGVVLKHVHAPGPGARIVVQCLDGGEVTKDAGDVVVVDRSYLRVGMAVASASDPGSGQVGVVTCATSALDLVRLLDDGGEPVVAAKAVAPETLRRVREFALGDYVVSGPWLGRVFEVSLDVDVAFDGADVCRVTQAGSKLRAVNRDSLNLHTNSVFYPGQRVVAGDASVFMAARWLKGYWKPSHGGQGTVSKVETASVLVYWVASSRLGTDTSLVQASAPPHQQSPRDLTFFCSGDAGVWAVGDRCFFRAPCYHADLGGGAWPPQSEPARALTAPRRRRNRLGANRTRRVAGLDMDKSMSVSATHTTVDVVWQDGTRQRGVPSVSLLPFVARNDHDFFPGERVVRKGSEEPPVAAAPNVAGGDPARLEAARVGVVGSLSYKDQTVRVSWLKAAAAAARAGEAMEKDCHETLSAYELRRYSKCDPFYGAIVVRRSSAAMIGGDAGGSTEEQTVPAQGNKDKKKGLAGAVNDLSWVGHIVDLCGAHVQVKWWDGNTSKVLLEEIAVVKQQRVGEMLREIGDWVSYEEDVDMNNAAIGNPQAETAAIINNNNDGEGDDDSGSESGDEDGHPVTRRLGWVGVVIQTMIRLASKVLFQARRHLVSCPEVAEGSRSELAATKNTTTPKPMLASDGDAKEASTSTALCQGGGGGGGGGDGDYSTMEGKAEADGTGDDKSFHFAQFDVVQSPLDHHYIDNNGQGPIGGRQWTKRVQKEWKVLENNLPDTIFVRAYEDRMDLLRVVMVGARGTPYHDGLFFFDLQLPPSYPATPPLVNYRSFGLRLNPNLYPSGTVCLSLLNTYGGHGTELWSPEASTVLQVVVSIQGLVLNAQPYYNGAGYTAKAGTPEGLRNELPYSENAYLLNLQTMVQLLRRPPAGFEDFVRGHFNRRGQHVLRACEAYLESCHVGTLDDAAERMSRERRPCSTGFKLTLLNAMPRLVEAFAGVGVQGLRPQPLALQVTTQ